MSCCRCSLAVWFCGRQFTDVISENRTILRAVAVVVTNVTPTAQQSCDSWDQIPGVDRKETVRSPQGRRKFEASQGHEVMGYCLRVLLEVSFGFGYCRCMRLSPCPCVCVFQSLACPRDDSGPVQARIIKFGPKMQNTLVKVPIVSGEQSILTSKVKFYLKFEIYPILSLSMP